MYLHLKDSMIHMTQYRFLLLVITLKGEARREEVWVRRNQIVVVGQVVTQTNFVQESFKLIHPAKLLISIKL